MKLKGNSVPFDPNALFLKLIPAGMGVIALAIIITSNSNKFRPYIYSSYIITSNSVDSLKL